LFCTSSFGGPEATWKHCSEEHAFDFVALKKKWGLDVYGSMKFINYIRRHVLDNPAANSWVYPSFRQLEIDRTLFEDERYLHPVLEDDALLYEMNASDDNSDFSDDEYGPRSENVEDLIKQLALAERRAKFA
jgi:protein arginine N-methyltransferase 3